MSLSTAVHSHFETLTQRTFYVVDTEYTNADDGNHLISLAVVPVVRGKRAPAADELYLVMNPGVPISAETRAVHGFTDEAVAGKRPFAFHAPRILAKLNDPTGVFVCHTGADVHVLRSELERLDALEGRGPNEVGLADLPDLPIIDTSALPRLLRVPEVGSRSTVGLARLASIYRVANRDPHNARSDARTTAAVLIKLLLAAAAALHHDTLEDLLAEHDRGTLRAPKVGVVRGRRGPSEPHIPEGHLARHTRPLLDPATPAEVDAWVEMATECVQLRCRHLADAALLAGRENGHLLFDRVYGLLAKATEPGQPGTLFGALARLIEAGGSKPALSHTHAVRWLLANEGQVTGSVACGDRGRSACPSCRDHLGCPRDTLYQTVTDIAVLGGSGKLSNQRIKDVLVGATRASTDRALQRWKNKKARAFMMWRVLEWEADNGVSSMLLDRHLAWAAEDGLHLVEPRLALLVCRRDADRNQAQQALDLAEQVLNQRTSDPAYEDLAQWRGWALAALERRSRAASPRVITHPRLARPEGRTNYNPYSVP